MASCPKCGGRSFSLEETVPSGSRHPINLVVCGNTGCSAVVGALEAEAVGKLVYHLANAVDRIATRLQVDSGLPTQMRAAK